MKFVKKILCFAFALTLLCTAAFAVGCGDDKADDVGVEAVKTVEFRNFEQWGPDFQITRLLRSFGKVSRNTDKQYVHNGEYSMKIQPMGGYWYYSEPVMYFETISKRFNYDYSDFTKVDYVSMWIYNANDAEKTVTVGLVTDIVDYLTITSAQGTKFTLQPGQWQEVTYYVDFNAMNISTKVTSEMMTAIKGIYLGFDNAKTENLDEAPVFYLDDVNIGYKDAENTVSDVLKFDAGEICDFEKIYQKYVFVPVTRNINAKCVSQLEVVRAADCGIEASSGNNVLKLTAKSGDTNQGTWPGFNLPASTLHASGITTVAEKDYENTYFAFDVYNATDTDFSFYMVFRQKDKGFKLTKIHKATAGEWTTFKISLAELGSVNSGDVFSGDYAANGRVTDPEDLLISYGEFLGAEDGSQIEKIFYFDNFRIIRL